MHIYILLIQPFQVRYDLFRLYANRVFTTASTSNHFTAKSILFASLSFPGYWFVEPRLCCARIITLKAFEFYYFFNLYLHKSYFTEETFYVSIFFCVNESPLNCRWMHIIFLIIEYNSWSKQTVSKFKLIYSDKFFVVSAVVKYG